MPKMIDNAENLILSTSKSLLEREGYKNVTIRRIAGLSGIAGGTVYNYYSSKDEIILRIMINEWEMIRNEILCYINTEENVYRCFEFIYNRLRSFTGAYSSTWKIMIKAQNDNSIYNHEEYYKGLNIIIRSIIRKCQGPLLNELNFLADFIGRNITAYAMEEKNEYKNLEMVLKKVLEEIS